MAGKMVYPNGKNYTVNVKLTLGLGEGGGVIIVDVYVSKEKKHLRVFIVNIDLYKIKLGVASRIS